MQTKDIRGMRDIPTIQELNKQPVPMTRPQAATELARLEHEKARLERELRMWTENQEKTEERLQRVKERLALVQEVLTLSATDSSEKPARTRRPRAAKGDSGEGEAQGGREVPLEY